jgi:hypothetical protein
MDNNVVSFIAENIFLFLPLGIIGIVATIYLYVTGERKGTEEKEDLDVDYIALSKFNVNIYVLIYLFIFIMMIVIGLLSNFIIPLIIGGIFASIPMVIVSISRLKLIVLKVL